MPALCSLLPQPSAAESMDAATEQACSFQQAQADWQQLLLAMKQRRQAAQVSLLRLPPCACIRMAIVCSRIAVAALVDGHLLVYPFLHPPPPPACFPLPAAPAAGTAAHLGPQAQRSPAGTGAPQQAAGKRPAPAAAAHSYSAWSVPHGL